MKGLLLLKTLAVMLYNKKKIALKKLPVKKGASICTYKQENACS